MPISLSSVIGGLLGTVAGVSSAARITQVTPPANGFYATGANLDFTVTFNQSVTVTGTPRIPLVVGTTQGFATYQSGSGSANLVFRYTVQASDFDADGITIADFIDRNGGTIVSSNGAADTVFGRVNTAGIAVGTPRVTAVIPPFAGNYLRNSALEFTAVFNQPVFVTGNPTIGLTIGSSSVSAGFISGSGTNVLRFRYTVQAGDADSDGIAVSSPLQLNGGSIGNGVGAAVLTFTPPTTTGVLVNNGVGAGGGGGFPAAPDLPTLAIAPALWIDANNDSSFTQDAFSTSVSSFTSRDANARVFSPVSTPLAARDVFPGWKGRKALTMEISAGFGYATTAFGIESLFAANGKDSTVYLVFRSDEGAATFGTIYYHLTSGAIGHYFRVAHTANNYRYLSLTTSPQGGANASLLGAIQIVCLQRSGDTVTGWLNGQQFFTAASVGTAITPTNAQFFLGTQTTSGGSGMIGLFGEGLWYPTAHNTSDRQTIEDYLAVKWLEGVS